MPKQIIKLALKIGAERQYLLPKDAEFLSCAVQQGIPCVWFLSEAASIHGPLHDYYSRIISMYETGQRFPERSRRFLGTIFFTKGSEHAYHIFEELEGL